MTINHRMSHEQFRKLISKKPHVKHVVTEQNSKSIPISILERKMDDIFGAGMWSRKVVQSYRELNEYIVVVHVEYTHPVTGKNIVRSGIGVVPIQGSKGSAPDQLHMKKINALHKNAPAAQAYAFKNAVKSIGVTFGRDLNRKSDKIAEAVTNQKLQLMMDYGKAIGEAKEKGDIVRIMFDDRFTELLADPENMKTLITKKAEISKTPKLLPNG